MSRKRAGLAVAGILVLVGGAAFGMHRTAPVAGVLPSAEGVPSPEPSSGPIGMASRPISVRYTFDGGIRRPIADASGKYELRALGRNGGVLHLVREGPGLALSYPNRCRLPLERDCPRVILEGKREDSLNPGRRPLRYGASVRMTHADLADGANVLQKGYSVGGKGQFKLQVDHLLGHPSCVLTYGERIYKAEASIDIADGKWHELVCSRTADLLTVSVDGVAKTRLPIPSQLSIANPSPLRIGGKGTADGNDQFAGRIDDVFLDIGG